MVIKNMILGLLAILLTLSINCFSQLSVSKLKNIELGKTFTESKSEIKKIFSSKPLMWKADFLGAYRIEYENVPFDYYGDANINFQYVKDTLVSAKVEFSYNEKDTIKFKRLLNTIIKDFTLNKDNILLKKYSNINTIDIMKLLPKMCISGYNIPQNISKTIHFDFVQRNYWEFENSQFTGKYLQLFIKMGKTAYYNDNDKQDIHCGCGLVIGVEIISENLQDLKFQYEDLSNIQERLIKDVGNEVSLKYKNGIYSIPVKINDIIAIDFVLDPGAADVSISPDIFIVLYKAGTIQENDFIGEQMYQFADGSTAKSSIFNIKSLQLGEVVLNNVRASISKNINSPLLLGQSALKKFSSYQIDNDRKLLILE